MMKVLEKTRWHRPFIKYKQTKHHLLNDNLVLILIILNFTRFYIESNVHVGYGLRVKNTTMLQHFEYRLWYYRGFWKELKKYKLRLIRNP